MLMDVVWLSERKAFLFAIKRSGSAVFICSLFPPLTSPFEGKIFKIKCIFHADGLANQNKILLFKKKRSDDVMQSLKAP